MSVSVSVGASFCLHLWVSPKQPRTDVHVFRRLSWSAGWQKLWGVGGAALGWLQPPGLTLS